MGTVTSIAINQDLITTLTTLLKQAKAGEVTSIAAIVMINDDIETIKCGDDSSLEHIAMVNLLAHELMQDIMSDE